MNLYEFNRAGYNSLPNMKDSDIESKKEEILNHWCGNGYYFMLVCNELHYYTLFTNFHENSLTANNLDEIFFEIDLLGDLKGIEIQDTMIEFWISKNNECHMYAFFNYDRGVIEL